MDDELRELERRWRETGAAEDANALVRARIRASLARVYWLDVSRSPWRDDPEPERLARIAVADCDTLDVGRNPIPAPPGHAVLIDELLEEGLPATGWVDLEERVGFLSIREMAVSRRHFQLQWRDFPELALWFQVTHAFSSTFVNQHRRNEAELNDGDLIVAGGVAFRVRLRQPDD